MVARARHGRFGPLDGMRGVGALTVLVNHAWPLSSQVCGIPECNAHFGYLAVDMFFVLSGFVISYSYDPRFATGMTFREFITARVVRLYPIFFVCALIGCLPFLWYVLRGRDSTARFLLTFATNILMLPAPNYPALPDPYPLVSPAWSLFFELFVANVSYGLAWKRLTNAALGWIIAVSLAVLVATLILMGTINGGSLWKTFLVGFPRVCFAFYAGVAIHRAFVHRAPPAMPSILLLVLIAASFWPKLVGWQAQVYEIFCVAIAYPGLIYLGASARERVPQLGAALGEASYALYLVHIPILMLVLHFGPYVGGIPKGPLPWASFVVVSLILAFLISGIYDRPARRLLSKLVLRTAKSR